MIGLHGKQQLLACGAVVILIVAGMQPVSGQEPDLEQIWNRLEQLERQNQQLAEQNSRLQRMIDPHATGTFAVGLYDEQETVDGPANMSAQGDYGSDCCKCCPHCDFCSCLCPQQPAPCIECPHVSTLQPYWNVNVFGSLITDIEYNTSRPIAPGQPFLLAPDSVFGFDTETFDMHARQTQFGVALTGPEICGLQAGGLALITFYNDAIVVDQYGILPLLAYGELKNEDVRFAAGLQFDVFCPNTANILPFSILSASGNAGNNFRGQARMERYLRPTDCTQWTIQLAISEPIATGITRSLTGASAVPALTEDNGWPNIEGRVMYGSGTPEQVGLDARRPFEVGLSGVVGQVRRTQGANRVVSDVWGVGLDYRWKLTDRFGVQGEVVHGQGLGTYNAGILQTINAETFNTIRTTGGWVEAWYYWTPCVHSHIGYGIDDPRDADVAVTPPAIAPLRNETWFANWLWDVTPSFRIGFEFAWLETAYNNAPDAEGAGFHTQFRWSF